MTEWNAPEYDRVSALQRVMAEEVLALLHLRGDERILDVGCGNGRTTAAIAAMVPRGSVVGVDASAAMVDFAKETQAGRHPNLLFQVSDARRLPFRGEFDYVVSFNALHWIPDQSLPLEGIRSALRPGGRAQLRLVPKGPRKSIEDVLEETRMSPRWAGFFNGFTDPYLHLTAAEYAALAARHGFGVLDCQVADKAWDFGSRDTFAALGKVTMIEWTQRLPEPLRSAFIDDVLDRYQAIAATGPGEENVFRFYQMDIALALA